MQFICECLLLFNYYYLLLLFCRFFKQWTLPYFPSCHEQTCLFEFSSLAVILEHYLCFINMVLLLMLTHCFFSRHFYCPYSLNPFIPLFLIICHNLLSSFPFTISSSQNLITPLHSNHLPCRRQKVIVLPTVKGKRLPPTIHLPKPWVKRLSIPNRTIPRSRKGVTMRVVKCYL